MMSNSDEPAVAQRQPTRRQAEEFQILAALSAKMRNGEGWTRRGVRGWVFTDELGSIAISNDNRYPDLAARGLICREDVQDPGRKAPLYLNRITQAGEDHIAEHEVREPIRVPSKRVGSLPLLEQETIYVPSRAWRPMMTLIAAPEEQWTTTSGLESFFDEDRRFLEKRGLLERRQPAGGQASRRLLYRATPLGRGAVALDSEASPERVQIRVPGIRRVTSFPQPKPC
jgi:hypothetical protein